MIIASLSQCHQNKCYWNKLRGARTHRHFPEWRHQGNKKPLNDIKSELNVPTRKQRYSSWYQLFGVKRDKTVEIVSEYQRFWAGELFV